MTLFRPGHRPPQSHDAAGGLPRGEEQPRPRPGRLETGQPRGVVQKGAEFLHVAGHEDAARLVHEVPAPMRERRGMATRPERGDRQGVRGRERHGVLRSTHLVDPAGDLCAARFRGMQRSIRPRSRRGAQRKEDTAMPKTVRDVMTLEVTTLGRNDTLLSATDIMNQDRIRHFPVVDEGEVVGVVSQRDLYKASLGTVMKYGEKAERTFLESVAVKEIMVDPITVAPDADVRGRSAADDRAQDRLPPRRRGDRTHRHRDRNRPAAPRGRAGVTGPRRIGYRSVRSIPHQRRGPTAGAPSRPSASTPRPVCAGRP